MRLINQKNYQNSVQKGTSDVISLICSSLIPYKFFRKEFRTKNFDEMLNIGKKMVFSFKAKPEKDSRVRKSFLFLLANRIFFFTKKIRVLEEE